ncbi:SDR family oxidoreductase [Sandaracinus amylolyticus]|uniref:SDR family oxidoreductase n=1 Tax=Sandaracinus amylolyticus TaxID=927083 RepID=UPI00069DE61D|nr:NAD(P)H-binding protein [Sandaracinus amylolyticus]
MTGAGFVVGATGLTGRHVVTRLVARGHGAIAHVRPDSPSLESWRARFSEMGARLDATPWDEGAMRATLIAHRPTWVFGCLGTTRARAREAARAGRDASKESYDAVDVALTEMTIRAAKDAGVQRFVYLSSIGAGDGAQNAYLAARTKVETTLRESGLPYTIVRPSFILGDRDAPRAGENVFGAIADAGLSLVGALGGAKVRDRYRSITGEQLAQAMVAIAEDPGWRDRIADGVDLQRLVR